MRILCVVIAGLAMSGCRPRAQRAASPGGDASADAAMGATGDASSHDVADATADAGAAAGAGAGAEASATVAADAGPAVVERVAVPKDRDAVLVRGRVPGEVRAVFVPGVCSNATAYLKEFPETAREHGGILAIDGEKPCGKPDSGFRSFVYSAAVQKTRLMAALAAAGVHAPADGLTLVGYSAGASLAQMIHSRWPKLFPRVVLIAPPDDPDINYLVHARAVVSMSCSRDVPWRMKGATQRLARLGVPSLYLEMPDCSHGEVADAERIFGEAFDFLDAPR